MILDLMLPGIDGFQLLRRPRVAVNTTHVLVKPFAFDELLAAPGGHSPSSASWRTSIDDLRDRSAPCWPPSWTSSRPASARST
jgi:hypothetical protein